MLNPVGDQGDRPIPFGAANAPDIRALVSADIPAVVALFHKTFRNPGTAAPTYIGEVFAPAAIAATGYFEPRAVQKLAKKCAGQSFVGFRDNMAFVGVLSTQLWHREFVHGGAATETSTPACAVA